MFFRRGNDFEFTQRFFLLHENLFFADQFQQREEHPDHLAAAAAADDQLPQRQPALAR